ncbi:MAG: hypothetical protein EBR86_04710 [Planctomycetia bacterium]|nr:hypothetical protein [Planctomycetia bacterium]
MSPADRVGEADRASPPDAAPGDREPGCGSADATVARRRSGLRLAVAHLAATAFMVGLIWYVQLVHYPLMASWPHEDFPRHEAAHRERTGWVVVPMMLAEGALAAGLVLRRPRGVPAWLPVAGLLALVMLQASTFLIQVPCHERLALGWDGATHAWLVQSNWIRTLLWSLRGMVAAAIVVRAAG